METPGAGSYKGHAHGPGRLAKPGPLPARHIRARTGAMAGTVAIAVTKFGQVTVSRIAYRSPGRPNVHPLDAVLNLPEEKHSHGLRKLAAIEAARGSMEAARRRDRPRDRRADRETPGRGAGPPLRRATWRRFTCSG